MALLNNAVSHSEFHLFRHYNFFFLSEANVSTIILLMNSFVTIMSFSRIIHTSVMVMTDITIAIRYGIISRSLSTTLVFLLASHNVLEKKSFLPSSLETPWQAKEKYLCSIHMIFTFDISLPFVSFVRNKY